MLEAILESPTVMVVDLILILWIDVAAPHLPEKWMELILITIFLEIIQQLDLVAVSLEIRPYIPVNWNNDLALEILSHAQDIHRGHLVLHADWILAEGAERYIDIVVLAMFRKINGEMRIT